MPTNGVADDILYSISKAPVYTYGMITISALVLAYLTYMDDNDESEKRKEKEENPEDNNFAEMFAAPPETEPEEKEEVSPEVSPEIKSPEEPNLDNSLFGSLEEPAPKEEENKTGGKSRKTKSKKHKKRKDKKKSRHTRSK